VHGAGKSTAPAQTLAVAEDFCSGLETLPCGPKAALRYGSICASLATGKLGDLSAVLNRGKHLTPLSEIFTHHHIYMSEIIISG